jgi:hypothetical protein
MTTSSGLFRVLFTSHLATSQPTSGGLAPSVVGGLIGGVTVLVGVLCAEYLARRRERTQRFKDEVFSVQEQATELFYDMDNLTRPESIRLSALVVNQLGRLIAASQPPQYKARKKQIGTRTTFIDFVKCLHEWKASGTTFSFDDFWCSDLDPLIDHQPWWRRKPRFPELPDV